ncbi:MAG: phospholipase D family protein [Gammaproteobacteria bacterium]|nr:phospholipase D family protein [Gammaproteobacteria bacterium]
MKSRPDPIIRRALRRWLLPLLALGLLGGCASLPSNGDREPSFAIRDTADTALARMIQIDVDKHPGKSGFYLLPSGLDAFAARALLAFRAEKTIDAQYYLMHHDLTGKLFLDLLVQEANLGVRVRLLVDDMALNDSKDLNVAALDAHPNIEIRVFNPFNRGTARWIQYVSRLGEVTRRMHNKSFTIDNRVTIIGGRNIGNEYFEVDENLVFGDLDVIAVGPVVNTVSSMFDLYWNDALSYPVTRLVKGGSKAEDLARMAQYLAEFTRQQADSVYLNSLNDSPIVEKLSDWSFDFDWGEVEVLYDDPAKITAKRDRTELMLSAQLNPYLDRVKKELLIFSAYFVPGKDGVALLKRLRQRGVRVRVITNSLASTDVAIVHAGYARYRRQLLKAGVELYEVDRTLSRLERKEKKAGVGSSKASLHAKSFVIDGERAFIGSLNFDPRSVIENTELGLMIESPAIAAEMTGWFDEIAEQASFRVEIGLDHNGHKRLRWYRQRNGKQEVYITEPNTSFWRRLGVHMMRLLPIESHL